MSVSSEGILNWHRQIVSGAPAEGGVAAILDVDSYYSDLSIVSGARMIFTRSILFGANQLLGEYDKWKEKFVLEVQRSLEMCRGEQPGTEITKLLLTGAGQNVKDLAAYLGTQLNMAVEARDSLQSARKLPSTPSLKDPSYQAVSLTAIIGMGLAPENVEFNLIPDSVKLRRGLMKTARTLTAFGILLLTALATLSTYGAVKLCLKKERLRELHKDWAATEPARENVQRMQEVIEVVRQRGDLKWAALNVLSEVHRQVPKDGVTLDAIDMDLQSKTEKIHLEGIANTMQESRTLVQNLEQSELFRGVAEEGSTVRDPKTGKFKFKVVMSLEQAP